MPFVSKAQQGWAHAHSEEFGKKNLAEWDAATKGKHNLPEHVRKMHDGGEVPEDGVYALQKGEEVIPKDKKMAEEMKKHAGHGYRRTMIEHHDDGSHTMEHEGADGQPNKKYAVSCLDCVHDGLEDHLGEANDGEDRDENGDTYAEGEALEEKLAPGLHSKMAAMGHAEGA